jgi:hypothetical protein
MKRVAVAVEGGGDPAARWLADRLGPDDAELVPDAVDADVVVVVGDERVSALDRCRQSSRGRPCIVLVPDPPSAGDLAAAMGSGARAVISLNDDAPAVSAAVQAAAAFTAPRDRKGRSTAPIIAVTGGHGGAGASVLAVAIAASVTAPVALIDLDLAGGRLAELVGVPLEPTDPGLAAHTRGASAWAELRVDGGWCALVPAPPRPELAWLVSEGVPAGLVAEAALTAETVVADIGRAAGPVLEVAAAAEVIVVACRPVPRSVDAGARHARVLGRLCPAASVRLCLVGASRRDVARLRIGRVAGGATVDHVVPDLTDGATRPPRGVRAALAALVRAA